MASLFEPFAVASEAVPLHGFGAHFAFLLQDILESSSAAEATAFIVS